MRTYYTFDDVTMMPQNSVVPSRSQCDVTGELTVLQPLKLPIISSPMDTVTELNMAVEMARNGGIGCVHRFMDIEKQAAITRSFFKLAMTSNPENKFETMNVVCAIGVTGDYLERFNELVNSGCHLICLDVAHGDHLLVKNALNELKSINPDVEIIAGNIATAGAAKRLIEWGADSLRVGIGGGSLCETRIRTGVGVPMITCLKDVCEVAAEYSVPVIADGGIRKIGDICKALACGASTVMLGSLLAATEETPGEIIGIGQWPNEIKFKQYRGSASSEAKSIRGQAGHVEGNSKRIPYKGPVNRILNDIRDGLISSFSYNGAFDLEQYQRNVEFGLQTAAGAIEAEPHLLLS